MTTYVSSKVQIRKENNMDKQLLTRQEVQTILRVSKSTMFRLIHEKKIQAVQVGSTFRIRQSDLEQFLREHTEKEIKK